MKMIDPNLVLRYWTKARMTEGIPTPSPTPIPTPSAILSLRLNRVRPPLAFELRPLALGVEHDKVVEDISDPEEEFSVVILGFQELIDSVHVEVVMDGVGIIIGIADIGIVLSGFAVATVAVRICTGFEYVKALPGTIGVIHRDGKVCFHVLDG